MSPLVISLIAFGCILGGMIAGMVLRAMLPEHHLSTESKDVVKLGTGMLATLAALVLGLLIASAKDNFETKNIGLVKSGSKIIFLDRILAQYGPEAKETRDQLRSGVGSTIDQIWKNKEAMQTETKAFHPNAVLEPLQVKLRQLSPQNDAQRWLLSRALQVSGEIAEECWLLIERKVHSALPMPLFVMMVIWLVIIFFNFGLLSPRNATVIIVMLICSLSASASLFMILELDHPLDGLITYSSAPLRNVLVYLGQ